MKHNQNEEASKQNEKGASHQKQTPKNQENGNSGKSDQHGPSNRGQAEPDGQQMGKEGSKKHAETGRK